MKPHGFINQLQKLSIHGQSCFIYNTTYFPLHLDYFEIIPRHIFTLINVKHALKIGIYILSLSH